MGIVGLVGGLGPESTIDYYRRLLDGWNKIEPATSPSIVIDSLDVQLALRLVASDRPALIGYLSDSLGRLAGAGVDFIAMTANTPHIVFDELAVRSSVPLLSIVEVCADEAQRRGLRRLGLLGTRFTMEAPFYPEVFARRGLSVVTPAADERARVHERYVGQLLKGDFRDETRAEIVSVIERLRRDEQIDAVILCGTELPLLLRAEVVAGVPTLDTTALHVGAILARLRALDLEIAPASLAGDVARELITALNAELGAAYPEPGATHFHLDPSEVGPGAGAFVVATWRGKPVGCGAVRCLRDADLVEQLGANVGEVKRMYVAPGVRGMGIGRGVLERLEREARELGLTRLVLETGTRQLAALRMYRAAGFTGIPPYGEYVASPATSVCLSKAL
jgi:aspartate racemase